MNCWRHVAVSLEQQSTLLALWSMLSEEERHEMLLKVLNALTCAAIVHVERHVLWRNDATCELYGQPIPVGEVCEFRGVPPRSRRVMREHSESSVPAHYMCMVNDTLVEVRSRPITWRGEQARLGLMWPELAAQRREWVDVVPCKGAQMIGVAERERVS